MTTAFSAYSIGSSSHFCSVMLAINFSNTARGDGPELAGNESPTPLHLVSAHAQTDGTLWLHYEVVRAAGEKQ